MAGNKNGNKKLELLEEAARQLEHDRARLQAYIIEIFNGQIPAGATRDPVGFLIDNHRRLRRTLSRIR